MKIWNCGGEASSHVKPLDRSLISEGSQQAALIAQSYWGPLLIASQTWTRLKVKDILRSLMTVETEKLIQNKKICYDEDSIQGWKMKIIKSTFLARNEI